MAPGFNLDIKISDTTKFPSPHLWLEAWAKKNKKRLPSQDSETVTGELELFPSPEPPPERVQAEVVKEELAETQELTYEEESDRLNLERKVERAFYEAGLALRELRDRRLYRNTHKTFEQYCRDRFGYGRRSANLMIAGSHVVDNLLTNGSQNLEMGSIGSQKSEMGSNRTQILPTSERQVRPLTKLEPEEQREAWTKAVESAGGKIRPVQLNGRSNKDLPKITSDF
jgi:hypothetical protein